MSKVIEKTITNIVNEEIKNYALYSIYNRAIPNVIDGFKPTQRKIFFALKNFYKNKGFIIVSSLAGAIREKEKGNYHHGNDAAAQTIINMAKDYPTSNQLPLLLKKGEFGSRLVPDGAAAPRYISVKYNSKVEYIFRQEDEKILPKNKDIENPEPEFYIPIIPMILINGASGIATGFAVNIYPRNIKEITSYIKARLNKNVNSNIDIMPYFRDTEIIVEKDKDGNYIAKGKIEFYKDRAFKKKSKEPTKYIKIVEVPPKFSRESLIKSLNNLKDKKIIATYKDLSREKFEINVVLSEEKYINKIYDLLTEKLNEILTFILPVIDKENNTIKDLVIREYNNIFEIIDDFIDIRLYYYDVRIKKEIENITMEIKKLKNKILFIKNVDKLKNLSRDKIKKVLKEKLNFDDDDINYCLNLPMYSITKDNMEETKEKINQLKEKLNYFKNITAKELYLKELEELENSLF